MDIGHDATAGSIVATRVSATLVGVFDPLLCASRHSI